MRLCPQCWQRKRLGAFRKKRGPGYANWCLDCRELYGSGGRAKPRRGLRDSGELRMTFVAESHGRKLRGLPSSISSSETCPSSCALRGEGCFAEQHFLRVHWSRVPKNGLSWGWFLGRVRELPTGTLWRHNEAGDLAGVGDELDLEKLDELVKASKGTRGFTYTHKPLRTARERKAISRANARGFTVNLSADSLSHADELYDLGVGPVAAIVPPGTRTGDRTPRGRRIVICPEQTKAELSCSECGLCAIAQRRGIVGFLPHGPAKRRLPVFKAA
jgi:hypothetical protein